MTTPERRRRYRQTAGRFATGVAIVAAQSAQGPVTRGRPRPLVSYEGRYATLRDQGPARRQPPM